MKEIPLTRGKVAIVDDEDYERVAIFSWSARPADQTLENWYAYRTSQIDGKRTTLYLHRLVLNAPEGVEVDHRNGDGLDCRRENLRPASRSQQGQNCRKRTGTKYRYKGVSPHRLRWRADIYSGGRRICLGYFSSEVSAAEAYDEAASVFYGEFALLNFPADGRRDAGRRG